MVLLMERCKLVVEGAGAVGVAALLGGHVAPADRRHDRRRALRRQRRPGAARLDRAPPRDRGRPPAGAAHARARPARARSPACSRCVADTGANLVDVSHLREGVYLHVRETAVELVLETRGHDARGARDGRARRRRLRGAGAALIETERLRLRRLRPGGPRGAPRDPVARGRRALAVLGAAAPRTEVREWLAAKIARPPETGVPLAVELRASGELVGDVTLMIEGAPAGRDRLHLPPRPPGPRLRDRGGARAARARIRAPTACTASSAGSSRATRPRRACSRSSACAARRC